MRRIRGVVVLLIAGLALGGPAMTVGAPAPADCGIVEGTGIGAVRIGMSAAAALSVAGPPQGQQTVGTQVIYALRAPWWWAFANHGIIERVSTRSPDCRTARGARVGSTFTAVRDAYGSTLPHVSVVTPTEGGELLSYPLLGVAFRLRRDQVEAIEVFRAERLTSAPASAVTPVQGAPSPGATTTAAGGPTPTPTVAAGSWGVRSTSARVDEGSLTVSGTIENRAAPRAVYVEVRALNPAGREIGRNDGPVFPNPVPNGGSATFEVRVPIDDIARRYVVIVRPVGTLTGSLVEATSEIKDLQQFASVVAKQIQVQAQVQATPPTRDDFVVVVTNGSPLTVASVSISVEITATCRIPFPTPRTIQEIRSGSVVVSQLRPGASARATLPVSAGACIEFATWSATHRVGEIRIAE